MKKLTPNEAWQLYVGSQSVTEFMSYSSTNVVDDAVKKYTDNPQWRKEMEVNGDEEAECIGCMLSEHIRLNSI